MIPLADAKPAEPVAKTDGPSETPAAPAPVEAAKPVEPAVPATEATKTETPAAPATEPVKVDAPGMYSIFLADCVVVSLGHNVSAIPCCPYQGSLHSEIYNR